MWCSPFPSSRFPQRQNIAAALVLLLLCGPVAFVSSDPILPEGPDYPKPLEQIAEPVRAVSDTSDAQISCPDKVRKDKSFFVTVPRELIIGKWQWQVQRLDNTPFPQTEWQANESLSSVSITVLDLNEPITIGFASGEILFVKTVLIEGDDPDPKPPGPDPDPEPEPEPEPVDPAPIPDAGFRVLIVYESGDMTKYTIEQQVILAGADVREFLKRNCVPEDGQAGFRIYDADIDTSNDLPVWQKAMSRDRSQVPWVVISNGKTGFEGPLPATPSEFLELCKKYLPTK